MTRLGIFLFGAGTAWSAGNVGPVTLELADAFSISLTVVGLLAGTVFFAGLLSGKSVIARLAGRVGVDRAARLACFSSGIGSLLVAVSPILVGPFVGRYIAGIGMGMSLVLGPALARQALGVRGVGVYGAGVTLGIAGALGLGSVLVDAGVQWRWTFAVSALVGLAAIPFLPTRTGLPVPGGAAHGFGRRMLRTLDGWRLTLLFTALLGIPYALGAWLIHYLTEVDELGTTLAGLLAFASYGLLALFREAGAQLESPTRIAALAGTSTLMGAAGLWLLASGESAAALPGVILIGAGFGLPYATMYEEAERTFPEDPVSAIAFFSAGGNMLPFFVVPLVGSALSNGHGQLAFAVLGGLIAVAGIANLRPAVRPEP